MTLEPGSVALVPFPFSDLSASKKRPVLLLTAADARGDVAEGVGDVGRGPFVVLLSPGVVRHKCLSRPHGRPSFQPHDDIKRRASALLSEPGGARYRPLRRDPPSPSHAAPS